MPCSRSTPAISWARATSAQAVRPIDGGFELWGGADKDKPWEDGSFAVVVDEPGTIVDHAWFRGGWWDPLTLAWKAVTDAATVARPPVTEGQPAPGGSLFVPVTLEPGASRTIRVKLAWYVPLSHLRSGKDPAGAASDPDKGYFRAGYTGRFASLGALVAHWRTEYDALRARSLRFSECLHDTTLPPEVTEAVAANLSILKSPTVLRQDDGRMWAWEGCSDASGCCHGTCTHVWNYAQAVPHLFPSLERTLRETEFGPSQADTGHQMFRAALPIRPLEHDFHAAADGQLGGIIKVHRDWRISGDIEWLRALWPKVTKSLDYCIATWDPRLKGMLEEPHHNTYDIEFWGPNGMCTSFYLGALQAAVRMGEALGADVARYRDLLARGTAFAETDLYNGEYLHPEDPVGRPARRQSDRREEHGRRVFARSDRAVEAGRTRSTSTATGVSPTASSVRGWRWSAASARCSIAPRSRATCWPSTSTTCGAICRRTRTRSVRRSRPARTAGCRSARGRAAAS